MPYLQLEQWDMQHDVRISFAMPPFVPQNAGLNKFNNISVVPRSKHF